MLTQASAAVTRAREDGKQRCILRLFLPRGEDRNLFPPDESWEGGIMQLFYECSPLVRDLLKRLVSETAGVPPTLTEQRLDESGVDGESVWFAQSQKAADDCVGLVQPSTERLTTIKKLSTDCGPKRMLMLVNPQWKERDDPLDALSRKGGVLGALGNFMGGKAALEAELQSAGFVDAYTLAECEPTCFPAAPCCTVRARAHATRAPSHCTLLGSPAHTHVSTRMPPRLTLCADVCRGSRICLHLSYPYGWTVSYRNPDTDSFVPLLSGAPVRPTYQEVEAALIEAEVPFRFTEFDDIV